MEQTSESILKHESDKSGCPGRQQDREGMTGAAKEWNPHPEREEGWTIQLVGTRFRAELLCSGSPRHLAQLVMAYHSQNVENDL